MDIRHESPDPEGSVALNDVPCLMCNMLVANILELWYEVLIEYIVMVILSLQGAWGIQSV
jgi:hypothetical protein